MGGREGLILWPLHAGDSLFGGWGGGGRTHACVCAYVRVCAHTGSLRKGATVLWVESHCKQFQM